MWKTIEKSICEKQRYVTEKEDEEKRRMLGESVSEKKDDRSC